MDEDDNARQRVLICRKPTRMERASVILSVYDPLGKRVSVIIASEVRETDEYETTWNGQDMFGNVLSWGTYLIRLQSGTYTESKRMLLLK